LSKNYSTFDRTQIALEVFSSLPSLQVHKKLLKVFGPQKAIFISNLIEKHNALLRSNSLDETGGFYLTHKTQMEDLGISEYTLLKCKNEFKTAGIIATYMKGLPAKEYYKIDFVKLRRCYE